VRRRPRAAPRTGWRATLDIGGQEHFYLETQAAWAERARTARDFVSASTQHPSEVQAIVSHVLDLPRTAVVVQSPRMGGGFGGKETQGNAWAALVALAAKKTGRPVRVQLDRDLDMAITGKRHPFHAKFSVGFDDDGRAHSRRKVELTSDGGWALDLSESILRPRALPPRQRVLHAPGALHGPRGEDARASHTAFRGFGGPQGMVVIEEIVDRVARTLGLPPEVVRERNFYRGTGETNRTHYGERHRGQPPRGVWAQVLASSEFAARRTESTPSTPRARASSAGIAITPVKFGISFTLASFYNQAGACADLPDGSVQVNHGGTEMGQGLHTKMLGVAMRELGLPAASASA
jgi:xanthine dehydrogenase molybdopterin-binding subunit B